MAQICLVGGEGELKEREHFRALEQANLLDNMLKVHGTKARTDTWNYITLNRFYTVKQSTEYRGNIQNEAVFHLRGLISPRIYIKNSKHLRK